VSAGPSPVSRFRVVDAELVRVIDPLELLVQKSFFRVSTNLLQSRHSVGKILLALITNFGG
jgi:hypothetical protein